MPDETSANGSFEGVALHVQEGPSKGQDFPLRAGRNVIGRAPDASVYLDQNEISRQHACITVGDEIQLEDMGSALGTFLNGRLMMGTDFLFDNDEIRVGPYTLSIAIKRPESRKGILIALGCLAVATLLFAVAMVFPRSSFVDAATQRAQASVKASRDSNWRNWETFVLPGRTELEAERLPVTADAALDQYNYGTRLYQDRLGDRGNAYQAILYYKRSLAVLGLMADMASRPAIANRCISRIRVLQAMVHGECEKRVFAFQRASELRWWSEAKRVLREMGDVSPWAGCRYHTWALKQQVALRRVKKK